MSEQLFTVDQVARSLNLHVRTIRNYVAAGRLKAMRIGKQYRIARSDLDAFTGVASPATAERTTGANGRIDITSMVQIEAISQQSANRLTALLMGAAKAHGSGEHTMNVSVTYEEERDRLRVVLVCGDLRATADLISMIAAFTHL